MKVKLQAQIDMKDREIARLMESQSDGDLQAKIKEKNDLIARLILKVQTAQS